MVNLELFYVVQDNLLNQSVGFFYKKIHADIAADAMEKLSVPYVLDIERLAELLA
jgi:hypothetical protein